MKHESNEKNKLEIKDGTYTFNDIYIKSYVPKDLLNSIKNANVLLIPYEGFRGRSEFLFPEETYKFYDFLRTTNTELVTEICISDDDYYELELLSDIINIVNIMIQWVVFPVFTSITAAYLYDKIKKYNKDDVSVKINITVEKDCRSKTIIYEGNIDNFQKSMNSIDENIFK